MEIDKLIESLENLKNLGVKTFKLTFCEKNIDVNKLLDEIKLRNSR